MPPPDVLQTPNNKVYARMFELSNDAVMVVDRAGWIRNANARARSLFGYENTGFTQCKVFDLHPADVPEKLLPKDLVVLTSRPCEKMGRQSRWKYR